jgi:hypothetical protein
MSIDQLGVVVTSAVAASTARMYVYSTGSDGWPDQKLLTTSDFSTATATTYANATVSFTVEAGVVYWIGVHASANITIRALAGSSIFNLGPTSSTANNYYTMLQRTLAFATSAPTSWSFTSSEFATGNTPVQRMRAQ